MRQIRVCHTELPSSAYWAVRWGTKTAGRERWSEENQQMDRRVSAEPREGSAEPWADPAASSGAAREQGGRSRDQGPWKPSAMRLGGKFGFIFQTMGNHGATWRDLCFTRQPRPVSFLTGVPWTAKGHRQFERRRFACNMSIAIHRRGIFFKRNYAALRH